MKYLKTYEEIFNLTEAWEVDNENHQITGNSIWLDPEQLEFFKNLNLIFIDLVEDKYGTFPIYYEKDSEEI